MDWGVSGGGLWGIDPIADRHNLPKLIKIESVVTPAYTNAKLCICRFSVV